MLVTYLSPFKRLGSVIGLWLTARLWNEMMFKTGKDSVQSSNEDEANEDSGQEANACGSPPRRNVPIPTLHDVLFDSSWKWRCWVARHGVLSPTHKEAAALRMERLTRDVTCIAFQDALVCSRASSPQRLCTFMRTRHIVLAKLSAFAAFLVTTC